MQDNEVIICRGLPGSGKSTMANNLLWQYKKVGKQNVGLYSTDDYFVREDGKYIFDGGKLNSAHQWNFTRFQRAVDLGYDVVIVDNTHVQFWECLNYVEYALKNFYAVEFKEPETPWAKDIDALFARNSHSVPREAIRMMMERWDTTEEILQSFAEKLVGRATVDFDNKRILRTTKNW